MPKEITAIHLEVLDALGKDSLRFYEWMEKVDRLGLNYKEFGNILQTLLDKGYVVLDCPRKDYFEAYCATGLRPPQSRSPRTIDDDWDW